MGIHFCHIMLGMAGGIIFSLLFINFDNSWKKGLSAIITAICYNNRHNYWRGSCCYIQSIWNNTNRYNICGNWIVTFVFYNNIYSNNVYNCIYYKRQR